MSVRACVRACVRRACACACACVKDGRGALDLRFTILSFNNHHKNLFPQNINHFIPFK